MEGFKKNEICINNSSIEEQETVEEIRQWRNTDPYQQNFRNNHDSLNENEESCNSYNGKRELQSQDMFANNKHNSMEQEETCDYEFSDSTVVTGLYEMGRDCLEIDQDINQKLNDIHILQVNAKALGTEIEEKQKVLETFKVELLTEQDNYDDIQKKLNDEIEVITVIGIQQEALNKVVMNLFEQKFRVDQILETFSTEFSVVKENSNKILLMLEEEHRGLNFEVQKISQMKLEIANKKTKAIKERCNLEERLNFKIKLLKHICESLKLKYHKKHAILDYLKVKGDEEWEKCSKLEVELKFMQENEHKQEDAEKYTRSSLEERKRIINDDILEVQQKCQIDNAQLEQLIKQKTYLREQVEKLLLDEACFLQKCEELSKSLSFISTETQDLKLFQREKESAKEECVKLNKLIEVLEKKKDNILTDESEINDSIIKANNICHDIQLRIEDALNEEFLVLENKNELSKRKLILIKQCEEIKEHSKIHIDNLEAQMSVVNSEKKQLEKQISELNNEIESHSTAADDKLSEISATKQQLQETYNKIEFSHKKIEDVTNKVAAKQIQFENNLSVYSDTLGKKGIIKRDLETEIERRLQLQSEIEYRKDELQVIDCQKRGELKSLKDKCQLELLAKQDELEKRKNELIAMNKEQKKKVSDLQEDIVDEQKNELHLVKTIQKLTFIGDKNKRELLTLKNVIKTLDDKLTTIARAVTVNSTKDRESTIQSQSTVILSGMPPPSSEKGNLKTIEIDRESSSSGVSMHDNDKTWKKKLLKKQQMKQLNTQSLSQSTTTTQRSKPYKEPVTLEPNCVQPSKTTLTELQTKSKDKPVLRKYAGKSPLKTPIHKVKK